jgi:hypothetical protein
MAKEFSYEWLKEQLALMSEEDKKFVLAKLVPSIFVTQGDRVDTFALEANGKWSKDKYPRELLPAVRAYKTALLKELREAEYYIQYLQSEGCYPLGEIKVKVTYEERKDDNDL